MPLLVNQIETVRPAGIGLFRPVAKHVEHRRNLDAELAYAGSCDVFAFLLVLRRRENDVVFNVALHLPDVAGMRLGDVDHQESDAAAVLLVEFIEGGNLPPEGRSSIAAENEDDVLGLVDLGELDPCAVVELHQREIRGGISDVERTSTGAGPGGFKREQQEWYRARHFGHDRGELFWGLPHGPENEGGEGQVHGYQGNSDPHE